MGGRRRGYFEGPTPLFVITSDSVNSTTIARSILLRSTATPCLICRLISILLMHLQVVVVVVAAASNVLKPIFLLISVQDVVGGGWSSVVVGGLVVVGLGVIYLLQMGKSILPNNKPLRTSLPHRRRYPCRPRPTSQGTPQDFFNLVENGSGRIKGSSLSEKKYEEEREWSEVDEELLRKLMAKHPVGKPGRWEAIAEGFKGKYKVESVIAKSKELRERKVSDQDSYKKFLKDRKAVDKRVLDEGEIENNAVGMTQNDEEGKKESEWSGAEDLALLSALKAFPKDVAMRWEKIAASVPGKTKAACMKRVAELKKDFRSSKAT
ncbi:hypothetical protein BUALT_Bualt10G0016200 [Buddleja alternifolia]|uniref:Myb-like domain-containing protein n=1 Tax=Buddleja alternifolia TaxID=168488 RepID=A0AAV6X2H3_9LAMI|nr:hypothetical protein BUALT_Bualt10G0016200 [Buddleja alternifolia]